MRAHQRGERVRRYWSGSVSCCETCPNIFRSIFSGGTYNPSQGASQPTACTNNTCPEGFYCPPGSTKPSDCPAGFFCVSGQISEFQNPCPPGTYGNQTGLKSNWPRSGYPVCFTTVLVTWLVGAWSLMRLKSSVSFCEVSWVVQNKLRFIAFAMLCLKNCICFPLKFVFA